MTHAQHVAALDQQIAQLDALRGTPQEPIALSAQIGQLKRTRAWHLTRLTPRHPNAGRVSLAGSGNKRHFPQVAARLRQADQPLIPLP